MRGWFEEMEEWETVRGWIEYYSRSSLTTNTRMNTEGARFAPFFVVWGDWLLLGTQSSNRNSAGKNDMLL